jgi:hypothetical protein
MTTKEPSGRSFDSIESAHEYVALLLEVVEETAADIREEACGTDGTRATRRLQAFQLVAYKLEQLCSHLTTSGRLLNDLRTLRRILHGERSGPHEVDEATSRA